MEVKIFGKYICPKCGGERITLAPIIDENGAELDFFWCKDCGDYTEPLTIDCDETITI